MLRVFKHGMFSAEHSTSHATDGCFVKGTSIYCFVISGLVFEVAFANLDLGTGATLNVVETIVSFKAIIFRGLRILRF